MKLSTVKTAAKQAEALKLTDYSFLDGKFTIMLPETMVLLPLGEKDNCFKGTQRPDSAAADEGEEVLISYSRYADSENDLQINDMNIFVKNILARIVPGYVEYGYGTRQISGHAVGCVQYSSYETGKDMYNILFTFATGAELVYGVFSCPFQVHDKWARTVSACLETIMIND